jgi:hypothetical protein
MTLQPFLSAVSLAAVVLAGCTSDAPVGAQRDRLGASCNTTDECGVNVGAACATTCADGSNPCVLACVDHACVERGCPTVVVADASPPVDVATPPESGLGAACDTTEQCGVNAGASCATTCADGSNPCGYACVDHTCVTRGCPSAVDAGPSCDHDAASSSDADAAPPECPLSCADATCVKHQTYGGYIFWPDDAGACPTGRHVEGGQCVDDPTYECAPTPAACTADVTCACAASLCPAARCIDAHDHFVSCELDAP